jgi:gamma-glutamylcyclotransferase (GGCT)/AIG2-like uncharacterized protein YtfP
MNLDHMRRLCGWHFRVLGNAVLENYEFGPDTRGYANIRPKEGSKVHGVFYELDDFSLKALDKFEGYPQVFDRTEVKVLDTEGKYHKAWAYKEHEDHFGGDYIKQDYLKRVIAGARENRLPEEWIIFLEKFLQKK